MLGPALNLRHAWVLLSHRYLLGPNIVSVNSIVRLFGVWKFIRVFLGLLVDLLEFGLVLEEWLGERVTE